LLNRFFNEAESRFGTARALLPPPDLGLQLLDLILGGLKLKTCFLRRKPEDFFGYIDLSSDGCQFAAQSGIMPTSRTFPLVFELSEQLVKKCHLAAPPANGRCLMIRGKY
jgi:hypothetical protein